MKHAEPCNCELCEDNRHLAEMKIRSENSQLEERSHSAELRDIVREWWRNNSCLSLQDKDIDKLLNSLPCGENNTIKSAISLLQKVKSRILPKFSTGGVVCREAEQIDVVIAKLESITGKLYTEASIKNHVAPQKKRKRKTNRQSPNKSH